MGSWKEVLHDGHDCDDDVDGLFEVCLLLYFLADMEFVKKITPSDFQAKNFTPSNSPNFNSFSKKKHKK